MNGLTETNISLLQILQWFENIYWIYTAYQRIWWTINKIFNITFFIISHTDLLTQRFQYLVLILTFTLAFILSLRFDNIF